MQGSQLLDTELNEVKLFMKDTNANYSLDLFMCAKNDSTMHTGLSKYLPQRLVLNL